VIDTDVWVLAEKSGQLHDLSRWAHYGGAYMSVITASELLVGVERANTPQRRAQRGAFVEHLLARIPVLEFSLSVGRTHARMLAAIPKNLTAGAHDALIAATAIHHGYALLTRNVADFTIFAGLKLEAFS
jgi:predicted nucleic acid-binding protein